MKTFLKILKKITIGILNFLLIDLILFLILSCTMKDFLYNDLLTSALKSNTTVISTDSIERDAPPIIANKEIISEAIQDEEIKESLDEFIDELISSLTEEEIENLDVEQLEEKVIKYVKNNKEKISEKTGIEITDEMIDESKQLIDEGDTKKAIEQEINNYKNSLTDEEKLALKVFNIIDSKKLRIILITAIIVDLLLIALLQKSAYKWIKNLSHAMFMSGLSVIILSISIKYLIANLTMIVVNPKNILTVGITTMIFGIIISIVYKLMTKYYIKENQNEVS